MKGHRDHLSLGLEKYWERKYEYVERKGKGSGKGEEEKREWKGKEREEGERGLGVK